MNRMTRGKFLGTGAASVGAAGLLTGPAIAGVALPLNARYRSPGTAATIAYPSQWYLYPKLITDLTAPAELFSISDHVLKPEPSLDQSGLPDPSPLGTNGVLITILAQQLGSDADYGPGQPVASGISLQGLKSDVTPTPGIDHRRGWYLNSSVGYLVYLWTGRQGADLATADAILRSFRPG
jgi:hypothetical protein